MPLPGPAARPAGTAAPGTAAAFGAAAAADAAACADPAAPLDAPNAPCAGEGRPTPGFAGASPTAGAFGAGSPPRAAAVEVLRGAPDAPAGLCKGSEEAISCLDHVGILPKHAQPRALRPGAAQKRIPRGDSEREDDCARNLPQRQSVWRGHTASAFLTQRRVLAPRSPREKTRGARSAAQCWRDGGITQEERDGADRLLREWVRGHLRRYCHIPLDIRRFFGHDAAGLRPRSPFPLSPAPRLSTPRNRSTLKTRSCHKFKTAIFDRAGWRDRHGGCWAPEGRSGQVC